MDCNLCSAPSKKLVKRWYAYDNGEQFKVYVCVKCSNVHQKMLDLDEAEKANG